MNHSDLSRFDPLQGGCYPGGKAGSGVAQRIINRMPPHQVYIEPFLGGGAVLRYKRPAALNIGIDRDPEVIARWCAAAPQFCAVPDPPQDRAIPADRRNAQAQDSAGSSCARMRSSSCATTHGPAASWCIAIHRTCMRHAAT